MPSGGNCNTREGTIAEERTSADDLCAWFEREILPHRASLKAYLRRYFPNEADLDDIVQESFERVLTRSGDEPIDNPRSYLTRTAWSLLQSRIRRRSIVSIELCSDMAALDFQCDAPLPDAVCIAREELAIITAAYAEFPRRVQSAVRLVRLEGQAYSDVARTLDISVSGVEKQIRRAVTQMRARLEQDLSSTEPSDGRPIAN